MPYTEAVLYEVLRFSDISHLSVPRATNNKNVEFEGYTIQKVITLFRFITTFNQDGLTEKVFKYIVKIRALGYYLT